MTKSLSITVLLTLIFISYSFGQDNSRNKKSSTSLNNTSGNKHSYWLNPQKMTPLSFLETMKIKGKGFNKLGVVIMENSFPDNWLTKKDIDTLIKLVNSNEKCNCFLNPLSSYIPNDNANVGGYAIQLIAAYKAKIKVSFGLHACPKVDKAEAYKLIQWWTRQSQ